VRRSDLQLLVEAHRLTEANEILVVGSQSVLATWDETQLPEAATRSAEADMLIRVQNGIRLTAEQADVVTEFLNQSGILSEFDEEHGVHIDPISPNTAELPEGWEDRLVEIKAYAEDGHEVVGVCLDPYDACASKAIAFRDHDREFIAAMISADLIEPTVLQQRLEMYRGEREINHAFVYVQGFFENR